MNIVTEAIKLGNQTLTLEYGRFAEQANGAVLATYGETVVLATVVMSQHDANLDYFPLQVVFAEKLYAGGRIKGSRWVKRDGRPSDEAILKARLIDRSIRPLFPKALKKEVQVVATVLSADQENDPDIVGLIAASAALHISDIPWEGPIAGVRVGKDKSGFLLNPTHSQRQTSVLDLVVSGSQQALSMVEAGAKEVSEEDILQALDFAHKYIKNIIQGIDNLRQKVGKDKIVVPDLPKLDPQVEKEIKNMVTNHLQPYLGKPGFPKRLPSQTAEAVAEELLQNQTITEEEVSLVKETAMDVFAHLARNLALTKGIRYDGRRLDEIRPLEIEVGILPRTHGSAMFKRGATQALTITTLGAPSLGQLIESMEGEETKRYIHHYNMPPYTVGEVGRLGWPSRREIGHGALAERALLPVIPSEDEFPYTIHVVSEIMSAHGSTSQASVCGSTLSLMDAGVPIKKPVAGIAMGLITAQDGSQKHVILSDISGTEDHIGDMDFKVAGTKDGITALQMDIKVSGLTIDILRQALAQARQGRLFILDKMLSVIPTPRPHLSPYAPHIESLTVPTDKVGEIIGPGGKMIRSITNQTDTQIDINETENGYSTVILSSTNKQNLAQAKAIIQSLVKTPAAGETYQGVVKRIEPYGIFVEILPGKSGLVHVSKMSKQFVKDPHQLVKIGQTVEVTVTDIDNQGRINLSMI